MKKYKIVLTAFFVLSICQVVSPGSLNMQQGKEDSLEIKIDTMIARMGLSSTTPGGVVGIIKDGRFIFKKAYGLANFETKEPNKTSTLFNLASVSKQFTAAAILKLANEKKLNLNDDIRKYLTDFPDYGYTITIDNLIHHTCGIRSFDVLELMAGTLFNENETQESVYKLIINQDALNFKPGDEYMYTNSGYILLANIVEKISGKKFSKFIEEDIFMPSGMKCSSIFDNPDRIINNRANGHSRGGEEKFKTTLKESSTSVGESNVYTSLEDFLQWDNNFYKNKLGKWDFGKEMTSLTTLSNGDTCSYAFGLEISEHNGFGAVSHQGGMLDFTDQYIQIPSERLSVVCMFNIPVDVTGLAYSIIDLMLKGAQQPGNITSKPEMIKVDSSILKLYAGKYFNDLHGFGTTISIQDDHLVFDAPFQGKFEIYPLSDSVFFATIADIKFIFSKNANGGMLKTTIIQGDQKFVLDYLGKEVFPLKAEQLTEFTGDFFSKEVNVNYPVMMKDNKLYVRFPESTAEFCHTATETELLSNHGDYFDSPVGGVQFTRNSKNEVTGLLIKDLGRVRNLKFEKRE